MRTIPRPKRFPPDVKNWSAELDTFRDWIWIRQRSEEALYDPFDPLEIEWERYELLNMPTVGGQGSAYNDIKIGAALWLIIRLLMKLLEIKDDR